MGQILNRFREDRNYAIGSALFWVVVVALLLSIFLGAKIISEIYTWSQAKGEFATNTINVTGTGEVTAVPDIATFNFSVTKEAETTEEAQQMSAEVVNLAIEYLRNNGIDEKDIKTTSYNVYPQYSFTRCIGQDFGPECPPQERILEGYEVSQTVSVKIREQGKAGEFLTGVGELGITNISGLSFTIDDEEALKDEAREKAVAEARKKAELLADQLGVRLKKVVNFNENFYGGPIPLRESIQGFGGAEDIAVLAPEVPVGENSIVSTVNITYEIR